MGPGAFDGANELCCESKCPYNRTIVSLVAESSNDAQRIRDLEENLAIAGWFVAALFVFLCASIVAACAEVNLARSQIDRLNADVDFLEKQVFKTGGLE